MEKKKTAKKETKKNVKVQEKTSKPVKKVVEKEPEKNTKNNKFYFSYTKRIILNVLFIIAFLIVGVFCFLNSYTYNEESKTNVSIKGNSDYLVYLKKNDFYPGSYLESGMNYVAGIIDHIDITFNYQIKVDNDIEGIIDHNVVADLKIYDEDNDQVYYKNNYTLVDQKHDSIQGNYNQIIEKVSINYDEYNDIANGFKTSYGVPSKANLVVTMNMKVKMSDVDYQIEDRKVSVIIPLSQKSIDITINKGDSNIEDQIIHASSIAFTQRSYLLAAGISLLLMLYSLYKFIKLVILVLPKKSQYDKYVKKILTSYDRLIIISRYMPDLNDFKVVNIEEFGELLDVHDNIGKPIMYHNGIKHQKCYFYVMDNEYLYLLTLKAVDINK